MSLLCFMWFILTEDQHSERRRPALLLPTLHLCSRHREYPPRLQRLSRHHPEDAPPPVWAFVIGGSWATDFRSSCDWRRLRVMDCLRADGLKGEDVTHSLPADLLLCWAPYIDKHKHTYTHTQTHVHCCPGEPCCQGTNNKQKYK